MVLAWRKRNLLIFAAAAALLLTLIPMSVYAQGQSTVNATVTAGFAAVSTDISTVGYGTVNLGTLGALPSPLSFTATNDGTVPADFLIRGADTTPSGWALSATQGPDEYVHMASSDAFAVQTIVLEIDNLILETGIPALGTSIVSLKMDMPNSTTATEEQIAAVTIVAIVQ